MKNIFFVDSENIGDKWISLLASVSSDDEILVFYTLKSPHMNYKSLRLLKESSREVTFIECCEGSNALDFQLCTELGYRVHDASDCNLIIVTDDTGFDAVVKYWRKRGIAVRRIQGKACADASFAAVPASARSVVPASALAAVSVPESSMGTVSSQEADQPAVQQGTAMELPGDPEPLAKESPVDLKQQIDSDPNVKELLYLVGKDNLSELHESLQQLFGGQKATALYNVLKAKGTYDEFIAGHEKLASKEKQRQYCQLVFAMKQPKEPMPEDFPEFVSGVWSKKKNLNSFRASLLQKYGREKSEKYYSLFKGHIKILDKIQ